MEIIFRLHSNKNQKCCLHSASISIIICACITFVSPCLKTRTIHVICKSVLLENKMQQSNNPNTAQAGLSVCVVETTLCRLPFRGLKHSQAVYTQSWTDSLCAGLSHCWSTSLLRSSLNFNRSLVLQSTFNQNTETPDICAVISQI